MRVYFAGGAVIELTEAQLVEAIRAKKDAEVRLILTRSETLGRFVDAGPTKRNLMRLKREA